MAINDNKPVYVYD